MKPRVRRGKPDALLPPRAQCSFLFGLRNGDAASRAWWTEALDDGENSRRSCSSPTKGGVLGVREVPRVDTKPRGRVYLWSLAASSQKSTTTYYLPTSHSGRARMMIPIIGVGGCFFADRSPGLQM